MPSNVQRSDRSHFDRRRRAALGRGTQRSASSMVCRAALLLALICAAAAVLAGLGTRFGWWRHRVGFDLLEWAAHGALASALLGAVGAVTAVQRRRWRRTAHAVLAVAIGLVVACIPWQMKQAAQTLPAIHDITTDTEDPPEFLAVLPFRRGALNTVEYGGRDVAAQQRAAYPDIQPIRLRVPPAQAFTRAVDAAAALGWQIVRANAADQRIEAMDTTFWFGFIDDIAIRVRPDGDGSRIDVRSVSRVGRSDMGTNATRIRAFAKQLSDHA